MPNARELVRFLCANGYAETRQAGSHLILKHPDGQNTCRPNTSRERYTKGLFMPILRDAGFTLEEFRAR